MKTPKHTTNSSFATLKRLIPRAGITAFFCTALSLLPIASAGQVVNTESFDNTTFPPTGWTNLLTSGAAVWSRVTSGTNPTQSTHSGAGEAMFNSFNASTGVRALITPPYSLAGNTSGAAVSFWMYRDNGYNTTPDKIDVYYNTSASLSGAVLLGTVNRAIGLTPTVTANGWYQYSYSIPNTMTSASVYLILNATSAYGNNIFIDDVSWTSYPPPCTGAPSVPVLAISSATGCPNTAFNITAGGLSTNSGLIYQFQSSTSSGGTYNNISGATSSAYSSSTNTTTFYRMVVTCTNSGQSSTTSPVSYSVVNPGPCICTTYGASAASSTGDEEILNVIFGTMSNASTCSSIGPGAGSLQNRYSNYAGFVTPASVCPGAVVPFTVNVGTCGGYYTISLGIYIDLNQNGSFADAGELVYSNNGGVVSGNATGNITIPTTALGGLTRMRVLLTETSSLPGPTGAYTWGETEDYCVMIVPPPISLTANTGSICPNTSFTVGASGVSTYTVIGSGGSISGGTATLSPLVTTNFTISGTNSSGCVNTGQNAPTVSITTLASPNITITPSAPAICIGGTSTLTASGANTYTWGASTITTAIAVNPTVTTVYTVSGTGTTVCNGVKTVTLTVNPLPTITVNSGTICAGSTYTMNPSGALTYTYSGGNAVVTPSATISYSVSGTSNAGCVSASPGVATVTVHAIPSVSINSGSVCIGSLFLFTPAGASTYSLFGFSNPYAPNTTGTYTLTGTSSVGCTSGPVVSTVVVMPLPTVTIASPTLICSGSSMTLTGTGASTYTWSTGANGTSIVENPTATVSYYVIGKDANGCQAVGNQTINVNPVPPLSSTASQTFVCAGGSANLSASGADTYTWSTGSFSSSIAVTPSASTVYSVSGSNTIGCTSINTIAITVNTIIVTSSPNMTTCVGTPVTLTTTGGSSWKWSTNHIFSAITVTPPVSNTVYSVDVTDSKGCHHARSMTVTVNGNPTITASAGTPTTCVNQAVTLSASGASTYVWTGNAGSGSSVTVTLNVSSTYVYSVTGTDNNGCKSTATVSLYVDQCVGLSELTNAGMSIYPNPHSGEFFISVPLSVNGTFVVTDIAGRTMRNGSFSEGLNRVEMNELANGVYYLSISTERGSGTVKIVKQ